MSFLRIKAFEGKISIAFDYLAIDELYILLHHKRSL